MSSDYWVSTQRTQWKFTKESLETVRNGLAQRDLNLGYDNSLSSWDPQLRIYVFNLTQALGQRLNLRQRVISSAQVYILRLYTRISFCEINVFLLVATAIYVACKAEELPQHILTVCNEARVLWCDLMPTDASNIAECEFYMISELESCLIVYHPYRSLDLIAASMVQWNPVLQLSPEELQGITAIINDTYASDVPLIYSPYIVATACLYMTIVLRPQLLRPPRSPGRVKQRIDTLSSYLGKSAIDLEQAAECVQELVSLYARWEVFDHRKVHTSVLKCFAHAGRT